MVNKCSVIGCKSLYTKDITNVKLHRFPLTNEETLPIWIAATGRVKEWKPSKSSRLCGNHFQESEYIVGHGKGVLKPTAIPTIEYRMVLKKKKNCNTREDKQLKIENEAKVEIVQLNYNDTYCHENRNKSKNLDDNCKVPFYTNDNDDVEEISNYHISDKFEDDDHDYYKDNNDGSNYNETEKKEHEDFWDIKDICNRENQCYMFTNSFIKDSEPTILTSHDKTNEKLSSNMMSIDQSVADLSFNKIMALKLKRKKTRTTDIYSLYFKSLKKINKEEKNINMFHDDTTSFSAFIETQMKELCPYRKLYLATKHKIQKILMKAQLKIAS